ncbi:MAG: PQQ-dependent sugar dehydrogenase [Chloroflexi bacterium]|nr:PQQ-dependent sugar dehydrogenase [Chloroflexota bacterium]
MPGFAVAVFAEGLNKPTSIALAPDGRLFVAEVGGEIVILEDADGDGFAESQKLFAEFAGQPLGIAFRPSTGELYASFGGVIAILPDRDGDDRADGLVRIIELPADGWHRNNGIAFGPDGRLYITLGSSCNACEEGDPWRGTILVANPDGSNARGYAKGLRNVYDLAFHPLTGELYATDNGVDDLGPDLPPEELNRIVEGGDYGWPYCYGQNLPNPNFLPKTSCADKITPVAEMEPHSSADGMVFYTGGQFPAEYRNNLFVALWGSWSYLTDPPTGRKVVRIILPPSGSSSQAMVSNFMTGLGNPLDLAVVPAGQPLAGQLLIADYSAGKIYRVWALD